MRIQFLQWVTVDMQALPRSAWPQVTIRHDDAGKTVYGFRCGAFPELPDFLAEQYIAAGQARPSDFVPPEEVSIDDMRKDFATR